MAGISKVEITPGVIWVEVPAADLRILCGCPADSVKHLMRRGMIQTVEVDGVRCETGPNAILLCDVLIQNGAVCNLAEFPVLQMLYRQGMILPGHPNNKGNRPLLIGRRDVLVSQMQYIYRGNYGLISEEEMAAAGVAPDEARALMRLKLRFAFGRIQHPQELLDSVVLGDEPDGVPVKNGVSVRHTGLNRFEFAYKDERVEVDLNLPAFEGYECPYPLGASQFRREYFAVVHSGEGDGWDPRRPTMGSILVYQGRIFLVDAGPNLDYTLTALGIGVNEIEGIFHTHAHDDHFAGLTTLIQGDHRLKYFATPLVRLSVTKKLAALLNIEEEEFGDYFEVIDLCPETWNDIDGLEVRPVMSPHPVETTIMYFRTMASGGWQSYAHFADIVALNTLHEMITEDPSQPGISRSDYLTVKERYLEPATVKKVDIGGGLIHGEAVDFRHDRSGKIILAHTARKLTDDEKRIGSGASFGTVDVLVASRRDFIWRSAAAFLHAYFPSVSGDHLNALLNNPMLSFNPETILLKEGKHHGSIFLLLTGQVEMLSADSTFRSTLSAGALLGEITGLHGLPPLETYRAVSFVQALEIPCDLYVAFVQRHSLFPEIVRLMEGREFLRKTWLCSGVVATHTLNAIANSMTAQLFEAGQVLDNHVSMIGLVQSGRVIRKLAETEVETLVAGDFFGEEGAVFHAPAYTQLVAATAARILFIPSALLQAIPNVRLKLLEGFERRTRTRAATTVDSHSLLAWRDDYSVNVQSVDKQHKKLAAMANRLLEQAAAGLERPAVCDGLDLLVNYVRYHFSQEESLLRRYGYDGNGATRGQAQASADQAAGFH